MQRFILLLGLLWLTACSKETNSNLITSPKREFFSCSQEAVQEVQKSEQVRGRGEKVQTINRITYLNEPKRSHALVFYKTDKGERTVVITKNVSVSGAAELMVAPVSYSYCEGDFCNCLVSAVIHNDGTVDIGCSCSSCRMITKYP